MILVDSCAWIDYLRSTEGALGDLVRLAIERDEASLCGVVVAELLQGCRSRRDRDRLADLFDVVRRVSTHEEDWNEAGLVMQDLRSRGITVPLTDAIIAVVARRQGLRVLTIDRHFDVLPVERIVAGEL